MTRGGCAAAAAPRGPTGKKQHSFGLLHPATDNLLSIFTCGEARSTQVNGLSLLSPPALLLAHKTF